jgi:hypothetical protein
MQMGVAIPRKPWNDFLFSCSFSKRIRRAMAVSSHLHQLHAGGQQRSRTLHASLSSTLMPQATSQQHRFAAALVRNEALCDDAAAARRKKAAIAGTYSHY